MKVAAPLLRARLPLWCLRFIALAMAANSNLYADPPPGYYSSVDTSSPSALRSTLHEVIDDHTRYPYTSSSTDTWDILDAAQADPDQAGMIVDLYRNAAYPAAGGGNDFYNREHAWPSSYGFTNDGAGNYPYTDCHHLFLADSGYNSARSNRPYRTCDPSCTEQSTVLNNDQGGGTSVYPGNSNWSSGFLPNEGAWETWMGRRGDVARALFYLDVRYEGGTHGVTAAAEPDLILTNDPAQIVSSTSNQSVAHMGILSVLLEWHEQDPIDDFERDRNDVVFGFQGNRNPFVDHSEWVGVLFQSNAGAPIWINELHYDNTGADVGEFVEIAGPAGTDLSGYQMIGYNGDGGGEYETIQLSGTIPTQPDCAGTLSFAFPSMQNGPDGLALVDSVGDVIEVLSYEGVFQASDGPATGMTSTDIGVSESTDTPVGHSLQLTGSSATRIGFTWAAAMAQTPGTQNTGQTIACMLDGEPPAVPTGLMAVGGDGVVMLDWADNTEPDLAGYNVLRSEISGGPYTQVNGPLVPLSQFADSNVTNGVTYFYIVAAEDTSGNVSGFSSETTAIPTGSPELADPWINEIHYDNEGADVGEFIEIGGPAGLDLAGWSLVLYNGSGGAAYDTADLSGVIPDQADCLGTLSFAIDGIQNGSPDGVALVDDQGAVIELISYEGVFNATDGPALGLESVDIGVSETGTTPVGESLQLVGTGSGRSDFTWQAPSTESPGLPNSGQSLAGGCDYAPENGIHLR